MHEVAIVGGGPGGLYVAQLLASEGFDVALFEEHATSGDPVHCTGVIACEAFDQFTLPREAVLKPLQTVRFVSPSGRTLEYTTPGVEALEIDRLVFDRVLAGNTVGTLAIMLLAVIGFMTGRPEFLDIGLTYGLLNLVGTLAVLKFFRHGDLAYDADAER